MAAVDPRAQHIITCDLCSNPVELYCNPCHVNICSACSAKHMRSNPSKTHNVVLYNQRMLESVHPQCESHSDQWCIMFCKTCDVPICVQCITGSHEMHKLISIEENIKTSMKTIIEADTKELEEAIIPTYEGIHSELGEKAEVLNKEYDEVQTKIDQNGKKWHQEIDIVIKKQKAQAQKFKEENLNIIKNDKTEIQGMLSLARDVLKRNQKLLKSNDAARMKNYKSRNDELRTVKRRITTTIPSFTPIQIHGEHLYRQFGELKAAIKSELEFKIKHQMKPEIDINMDTNTAGLYGISYLLADKIWIHGKKDTIDLIDIQGTVLDTVKTLSGKKPQGLTVTKEGHLIYGDNVSRNINMVKNGQTSTIITLPDDWAPNGLCFTLSDDLLILMYKSSDFTEYKVVRYDKDYKVKQEIQYDDKGAPLYTAGKKRMCIAENKNTDICVSNGNANNVVTVNQSGKLRWRYTGNLDTRKYDSFDPRGIATDSQCHVIVADHFNHCVHVIDQDGKFILYIEKCGIVFPLALCVDTEDRLFVGQSKTTGCKVAVIRYLKQSLNTVI